MSFAFLDGWNPALVLALGCGVLLAATQVVILVLGILEKRAFGAVQLGTMVTPLCTGYPNLMIGLFGQEQDPLAGVFLMPLGLPWNILGDRLGLGGPLLGILAPAINAAILYWLWKR